MGRGRAPKGEYAGKTEVMSFRLTPDTKAALRRAPCFECRRCLGLGYESQREIPLRRAERRAQKIKMRLGGSNDPLEPFPQKPRRMHWRTYRRLRDQANAATAEADDLLAESMLGQFLDLVPPRRKRQRGRRDVGPKPPPAAGSPSTPSRPHRPNRP